MTVKFLAVDPGKVSGWAAWDHQGFVSGEFECQELLDFAWSMISGPFPPDLVVCESFIITAQTLKKTRGENWSLESVGALRWMCRQHQVSFKLQSPADAKSFVNNDRLKAVGWYKPGLGHDNDAARHLLKALADADPATFTTIIKRSQV